MVCELVDHLSETANTGRPADFIETFLELQHHCKSFPVPLGVVLLGRLLPPVFHTEHVLLLAVHVARLFLREFHLLYFRLPPPCLHLFGVLFLVLLALEDPRPVLPLDGDTRVRRLVVPNGLRSISLNLPHQVLAVEELLLRARVSFLHGVQVSVKSHTVGLKPSKHVLQLKPIVEFLLGRLVHLLDLLDELADPSSIWICPVDHFFQTLVIPLNVNQLVVELVELRLQPSASVVLIIELLRVCLHPIVHHYHLAAHVRVLRPHPGGHVRKPHLPP
mmetsp:Transcript_5484/g.10983  ORF Transcript_5484/g.10983 Transcript_5484/m.10983 type:complete len:276 (-) Transcript_5484:396-1223(-)